MHVHVCKDVVEYIQNRCNYYTNMHGIVESFGKERGAVSNRLDQKLFGEVKSK